mgnify:CR=1 FL=1
MRGTGAALPGAFIRVYLCVFVGSISRCVLGIGVSWGLMPGFEVEGDVGKMRLAPPFVPSVRIRGQYFSLRFGHRVSWGLRPGFEVEGDVGKMRLAPPFVSSV